MSFDTTPGHGVITQDIKHGFFKLPPELRIMIYKLCLVPGLIRPHIHAYQDHELPGLPLLRTCKAIFNEAGSELYKTTFVVSDWQESLCIFDACLRYPERRPMLKSLELRFGPYELLDDDRIKVLEQIEEDYPPETFERYGAQASDKMEAVRRRKEHRRLKDRMREGRWSGKMIHILKTTSLEHLRLNLEECCCHSECCDLYYNAFWTFAPGFARVLPKRLELVGVDEDQVESLREDWIQLTTFGTLTRIRKAPTKPEMIEQLKGWDFDFFMENFNVERKSRGLM